MTSLLTGLYPVESHIRHNSGGLAGEIETVAEKALSAGYKTAFFSGGAPILRKTGLHHGFEIFDDNISLDVDTLFRPAEKSFSGMIEFLKDESGEPTFSVAYVPDLSFTNVETKTDYGDVRNRSFESQLEELDESLGSLFDQLKKRKSWNSSYVIVVGLNGKSQANRSRELPPLNLFSENTQVSLFIKPPSKERDAPLQWNVDRNVSLVDVGVSIAEIFGKPVTRPRDDREFEKYFVSQSLLKSLSTHEIDWPEDRWIMSETGWPEWHLDKGVRYSFRKGHLLVIDDQRPKIYNTLLDRQEVNNLSKQDPTLQSFYRDFRKMTEETELNPWRGVEDSLLDKYFLAYSLFLGPGFTKQSIADLKTLMLKRPKDSTLQEWLQYGLLGNRDWKAVLNLAKARKIDTTLELLAKKQLGFFGPFYVTGCLELLEYQDLSPNQRRKCSDHLLVDMALWMDPGLSKEKAEGLRDKWMRQYQNAVIERQIRYTNYAFSEVWDLNSQLPDGPIQSEMILQFPEYQKFDGLVRRKR